MIYDSFDRVMFVPIITIILSITCCIVYTVFEDIKENSFTCFHLCGLLVLSLLPIGIIGLIGEVYFGK